MSVVVGKISHSSDVLAKSSFSDLMLNLQSVLNLKKQRHKKIG